MSCVIPQFIEKGQYGSDPAARNVITLVKFHICMMRPMFGIEEVREYLLGCLLDLYTLIWKEVCRNVGNVAVELEAAVQRFAVWTIAEDN